MALDQCYAIRGLFTRNGQTIAGHRTERKLESILPAREQPTQIGHFQQIFPLIVYCHNIKLHKIYETSARSQPVRL